MLPKLKVLSEIFLLEVSTTLPVQSNGYNGQGGHEYSNAGEDPDHPAEGEVVGEGPGQIEAVHDGEGDGQSYHEVRYAEIQYEDVPGCSSLLLADNYLINSFQLFNCLLYIQGVQKKGGIRKLGPKSKHFFQKKVLRIAQIRGKKFFEFFEIF